MLVPLIAISAILNECSFCTPARRLGLATGISQASPSASAALSKAHVLGTTGEGNALSSEPVSIKLLLEPVPFVGSAVDAG